MSHPSEQELASDRVITISSLLYVSAVSGFTVWHSGFMNVEVMFILAFLTALAAGRTTLFLKDWIPPVLLTLGYEYCTGLVPHLNKSVEISPMIHFDRWLFGEVPAVTLQRSFFTPGVTQWQDKAASAVYLLHFVVPWLVALLFWFRDRRYFKRYTTGIVLLSYASFLTYLLYPAMPPWLAAQHGYLPSVHRITTQIMQDAGLGLKLSLPVLFSYFNPTAAVPSLHAAYPLLSAFFLIRRFPRIGVPFLLYPLLMWLSVVYLGEHYVFDILVGALYAIVVYVAVEHGNSLWKMFRMRSRSSAIEESSRTTHAGAR